MGSPHFLGNFTSPAPLHKKAIGPPTQIAYYSCFSGPTNEYEYQSRRALKFYSPPTVPFSFLKAPDKSSWARECNYLDSLPQQGIEPVIISCERAGCTADLLGADVIARRGAIVNLALGKKEVYDVSFVEGKLRIFRKSFDFRTGFKHSGPYYGDCFEKLCARPVTEEPHGTFFSVVRRKIGDLDVIMAGEVDCSSSMDTEPNVRDYIELKTVKRADRWNPPSHSNNLLPKWYLQSHLLGIKVLEIGYRNFKDHVFNIARKTVKEVLRDAQRCVPSFDPAVDLGRAHAILSTLLTHFHALGSSVSAQDRFELCVGANGDAWITSATDHSDLGGLMAVG